MGEIGWVDFDLGSLEICPILLWQMGFWQKWLRNWAGWGIVGKPK